MLKRLREMNEWSQCIVLEQLAHYRPENPDDIVEIMVCGGMRGKRGGGCVEEIERDE